MKGSFFLSDEGYGHIIRQKAIMDELWRIEPDLNATVFTKVHHKFAARVMPKADHIEQFNNIRWHKQADSSPDIPAMEAYYAQYDGQREAYLEQLRNHQTDFIVSDFVYEAFELAHKSGLKSFGVGHFTWDWFFNKLYPRVISDGLFRYFTEQAKKATTLFFPPFTPPEILAHYRKNAVEVPFIVRSDIQHKQWPQTDKMKILVMDSGAGLMAAHIKRAIGAVKSSEWTFGVLASVGLEGPAVFNIPNDHLLVDYVRDADLVIGRPGFNTLSECVAYQTPMLLISEAMNPEMEHNISELKKHRLGAFMAMHEFEQNFEGFMRSFMKSEYHHLQATTRSKQHDVSGASMIAREILNKL